MNPSPRFPNLASTILGLLVFGHYGLFTLLPDSHSLMVSWPWVLVAEAGLIYAVIWSIWQFWSQRQPQEPDPGNSLSWLGGRLDWAVGPGLLALSLSVTFAEFPQTALWYCLIALAYVATLYGLATYLKQGEAPVRRRVNLFFWQAGLSVAFILLSLGLWTFQTVLPELKRLQQLQANGIVASYNFSNLYLRNWAPFGHPNYVAGYLLLALPVIASCLWITKGWQRWLWATGLGLGLLDLYTTNSRGGWLGAVVAVVTLSALLLLRSAVSRRWVGFGSIAAMVALGIVAGSNERLRATFTGLFSGGGEFTYRWITAYTGWKMGWSHPWTGVGPGNVPILYQRYRPGWAGQEAEAIFQLHSTPVQIWAELGMPGILILLLGMGVVTRLLMRLFQAQHWRQLLETDQILTYGIAAGLAGYSTCAITDYQLDNPAIAGFLILDLATLAALYHHYIQPAPVLKPNFQPILLSLVTLTLVGSFCWLIPVNQAWASSKAGFDALKQNPPDLNRFVDHLSDAYRLSPWESYYAYQLGWMLGNLVITNPNPQIAKDLTPEAIQWFERAIDFSPVSEFGRSSLGWLLLDGNPVAASQQFSEAARLVPARRMVFFGLGQSWLGQKQEAKGIEAIALEFVRHPVTLTSPLWQEPAWQTLYPRILERTETIYTELLAQSSMDPELTAWLHQTRGALRWWRGNIQGATVDFDASSFKLGKLLLSLGATKKENANSQLSSDQKANLETAIKANEAWALALGSWLKPEQKTEFLQRGWLATQGSSTGSEAVSAIAKAMNAAHNLNQWLQKKSPSRAFRVQRPGFSVLVRHTDGLQPQDLTAMSENLLITYYLSGLFSEAKYFPSLDRALVPYQGVVITSDITSSNP